MEYKIHKMENGLHRISMQSETIKLNCEGVTMEQAARIMQVFEGDAVKVTTPPEQIPGQLSFFD